MLDEVRRLASAFDVLHFHIDLLHFPVIRDFAWRTVTTLHGRLDLPDLHPFYRTFSDVPLVSISDDQRKPMPPVNWARPHPSRPAAEPAEAARLAQAATISPSSAASRRRNGPTAPSRSRRAAGAS